jgi:glycosyltransferase involved in cell wall biosynthesis
MTKVPISVIIPVFNEAKNLPLCLKAISWADEIFVIDSGSADGSEKIAESFGAKVVQFKFNGIWPKKKNWALDNLPLSHEWVFMLDADEVLSENSKREIRKIAGDNACGFEGYFINRRFMFMNKWLKHAYYPNWTLRFFKHRLGRYEKLTDMDTDSGDVEIHENVVLEGRAGYLRSHIDHYAFPTVETFVSKHNRYSNWEARVAVDRYLSMNAAESLASEKLGLRRRLKIISLNMPFRPLMRFMYIYILQRGFLDGWEGFYFARLHAFYELLCVCKTYELRKTLVKRPHA